MNHKSSTLVVVAPNGSDSEETYLIPVDSVDHVKFSTSKTSEGSVVDAIEISMKSGGLLELTPQAEWRYRIIPNNPRQEVIEGAILGLKDALIGTPSVSSEGAGK
jgi:hypothetical protein